MIKTAPHDITVELFSISLEGSSYREFELSGARRK